MSRSAELDAKIAAMVERWKEHDAIYLAARELRKQRKQRSLAVRVQNAGRTLVVVIVLLLHRLRRLREQLPER